MSTTVTVLLLGVCGVAVLVLVGAVVNSPDPTQPRRPRGYRPAHRDGTGGGNERDVEAPLPPARALEEQLVSFPVGHPEQARPVSGHDSIDTLVNAMVEWARTPRADLPPDPYRRPVTEPTPQPQPEPEPGPVEHHGADAMWSPTQELSLVPDRPIDAQEALEQDIEDEVRREIARIFDPIEAAIARLGHAEQDTCEWNFDELRREIEAARPAGAR